MTTRRRPPPKKRKAPFPRPKPKPKPKIKRKPRNTRQSVTGRVPRTTKPPKPIAAREPKKRSTKRGKGPVRASAERHKGKGRKKPAVATVKRPTPPRKRKPNSKELQAKIARLQAALAASKKRKRKPPKKPPKKPPRKPPKPPKKPPAPAPPVAPAAPGGTTFDPYDYFERLEKATHMVEEAICGKGANATGTSPTGEEYYLYVASRTDMDPHLIFSMFESPELFGIYC